MTYQQTSADAYASVKPVLGLFKEQIIETLRAYPEGITNQRIADILRREHYSVSGSMRGLVLDGIAQASGRFGETHSGRKAILWELA